jgi:hypothetical protein
MIMSEGYIFCLTPRCGFCSFRFEEGEDIIASMLLPGIFLCRREAVADQHSEKDWDGSFGQVPILSHGFDPGHRLCGMCKPVLAQE